MSSLCFIEAAAKRKEDEITEDEYLEAIVSHCRGARHGKNRLCNGDMVCDGPRQHAFGGDIEKDEFASGMASWIAFSHYAKSMRGKTIVFLTFIY
jgi:hypothetical protein